MIFLLLLGDVVSLLNLHPTASDSDMEQSDDDASQHTETTRRGRSRGLRPCTIVGVLFAYAAFVP